MSGRTLILLMVAIAIAVGAVVMVKNRAPANNSVRVLISASDIPAGGFVRADKDLAWADWPQANLTPSLITSDTHKIEDFNGSVARRAIASGEPITSNAVVRVNDGGFMSAVLPPGLRAVSIAVTLTSGNAGFLFPGDKIDLLLTHRIPVKDGSGDVLASETFIQNVRVLAIDQMLDNPENKAVVAKTITLEVTPKQAEMINVAQSLGTISVSLRSLSNTAIAPSAPVTAPIPGAASQAKVLPAAPLPATSPPATSATPDSSKSAGDYSTDNDVSKLMGNTNVRSKVSVYHGTTTEQVDFHQVPK